MTLLSQAHRNWPADEQDAVDRANLYRNHDPYPRRKAALLGSDDFIAYARAAGMIYPFAGFNKAANKPDPERVKPAAYEIRPGGKFFRYDEKNNLVAMDLDDPKNNLIHLPPNSISFVSTDECFRLPNYIAMRFNLRIQHVHRGILLGTGPMVDPGFGKQILIPLHNLTDDDYYIPTNKGLIWVEFTKTSWKQSSTGTSGYSHNVQLPASTEKELRDFLVHANQGRPIRSSIPKAILEAQTTVAESDARQKRLEGQIRSFGLVGLLALILTLAGIFIPMLGLIQDTAGVVDKLRIDNAEMKGEIVNLQNELRSRSTLSESKQAAPERSR